MHCSFACLEKGCVEFHFLSKRNLFPFSRSSMTLLETLWFQCRKSAMPLSAQPSWC